LTVGIIFIMVGHRRERTSSIRFFSSWPLAIIGGIFSMWGAFQLLFSLNAYLEAINTAHYQNISGIDGLILTIYTAASVAAALWLFVGILFIYLPVSNKLRKTRKALDNITTT